MGPVVAVVGGKGAEWGGGRGRAGGGDYVCELTEGLSLGYMGDGKIS